MLQYNDLPFTVDIWRFENCIVGRGPIN